MRRLLLSGLMVLAFSVTAFAGVDVSKLQLPGDITQAQAVDLAQMLTADLPDSQVQDNLRFYRAMRQQLPSAVR